MASMLRFADIFRSPFVSTDPLHESNPSNSNSKSNGGVAHVRSHANSVNASTPHPTMRSRVEDDQVKTVTAPSEFNNTSSSSPTSITTCTFSLSECVDAPEPSAPSSLHEHSSPPSARSIYSRLSPQGTKASSLKSFATINNYIVGLGPPSSASFLNMGKGSKTDSRRSVPVQPEAFGGHSQRPKSDGLPLIIQQARKGGSRLFRSLTRPSLFSTFNNTKDGEKSPQDLLTIDTAHFRSSDSSFETSSPTQHVPHLEPRQPTITSSQLVHSRTPPPLVFGQTVPPGSENVDDASSGKGVGRASPPSVDATRVSPVEEERVDYISTVLEKHETASERSLRRRLASSLSFKEKSNTSLQLRYARSELDLRELTREQKKTNNIAPGTNKDSSAAPPVRSRNPSSPSSPRRTKIPPASLHISNRKMTSSSSLKLMSPKEHSTDLPEARVAPSPASAPTESALSTQRSEWEKRNYSSESVPYAHRSILASSPEETPLLTPDRPSFSPKRETMSRSHSPHSPSSSRKTFPVLETPERSSHHHARRTTDEGANHGDAMISKSVTKDPGIDNTGSTPAYNGSQHASPQSQVDLDVAETTDGDDDDLEVHTDDLGNASDIFTDEPDLLSLTENWPLPPRRTLLVDTTLGTSWHRITPEAGYFKPGSVDVSKHRIHIVKRHTASTSEIHHSQVKSPGRHAKTDSHLQSLAPALARWRGTTLDEASFPSSIVLQPSSTARPPVSFVVTAANRMALISFCALHGEAKIKALPASLTDGFSPAQADVRLFQRSTTKSGNKIEDVMEISVGIQQFGAKSTSLLPFGCPHTAFTVPLPVNLADLTVVIAKKSFGYEDPSVARGL